MGRPLMLNDTLTITFSSIAIWRHNLRSGLQMVSEPQAVCSLVVMHMLVHAWNWCMLVHVMVPCSWRMLARADARWSTFWY